MSEVKREFKLYNNRPSQQINEMSVQDLNLLKVKAEMMSNACGYSDDGKGQEYWEGVICNVDSRIQQIQKELK